MKLPFRPEKVFPLMSNIVLPMLIFSTALLGFYLSGTFSPSTTIAFHSFFYVLSFVIFMILLYFNQSKPVFFIFCTVLCYVLINFLKNKYGEAYFNTPAYQNLCFFAPMNFAVFYFLPPRRLLTRHNIYILLSVFIQYAIAEQLSRNGLSLNEYGIGFWLFMAMLSAAFIRTTLSGEILDYGLFFAAASIFFGFLYSDSPSALSVFFGSAILCTLTAVIQNLYSLTYKDRLTGLASRNSYIIHAKNFPLKYSIGIISIDDYEKLGINYGRRNLNIITKLIAERIEEFERVENIYRYSADEFVIIYRGLDKNESFEQMETIRRAVASASFCFNPRRKPLKLTVSGAVSEKKRSDANSFEVLVRARKVLSKTRSFRHNVTSKA